MGEINIPDREREALKQLDAKALDELIRQCVREERATPLYPLALGRCGLYIAVKLQEFERALADYGRAKAEKKRASTLYDAERAARDLSYAVTQMQDRVKTEETNEQRFYVNDQIMQPLSFSEELAVRVNYRWRPTTEEQWTHGSVTFHHRVKTQPNLTAVQPKRKSSASQQERERQTRLQNEWNALMKQSLCAARDYFQQGGDGAAVPLDFQVKPDAHSGGLNNHSTKFWP